MLDDDDVTNLEPEEEPEVTEAEDLDEGDGEEGDEQEAEPELEDVEYEGKVHKLPKELKEALLRQADYTRKTQEVAEQRRELEARRQADQRTAAAQQQFIREYAQIESLTDRIGEYEKINWSQLNAQDPVKAQELWFQFSQLKDRRATVATALHQKQTALEQQRATTRAKQVEESNAVLTREIPNWGPELATKLREFGVAHAGLTAEEVDRVIDPRHVKLLNLAYIGHQLAEKQRKAMAKPKAVEAKPVPTVQSKGGKTDARLRDDLSVDEWVRRRDAQLRAKAR